MTWSQIGIFGSGMAVGGFLALGFAVLVLAPDLKRLRLAVDLLAARRKPGRKPRAAKAVDDSLDLGPGAILPPEAGRGHNGDLP